ncbi:MAG: Ribosomal protein S23 [Parcubacteria group bacterium GW2011_GWD2_38_11]|nr:MAG: Ribosomal protein S23 [Parcubacteria group bacterium GW2011_GWD2_38_11]
MKIDKFEDIIVWQESRILVCNIYDAFKLNRDFGFKDQIQRAAVSIMNNIAEGFERKGDKEFKRFLYIAKASCGEVRSMLYLGSDLKYIDKEDFEILYEKTDRISRKIAAFISKLNY